MDELKNTFFAFLDESKAACLDEAKKLMADDRKDEANTLKAKANIYDIFKAIWNNAQKQTSDKEAFAKMFLGQAKSIPMNWEKSLEAAKQHNDMAKIVIEEAKLSAVDEVKAKFSSLL